MTDAATESFSNWKQLQPVFEGQTGFGPRKNEKNIAAEKLHQVDRNKNLGFSGIHKVFQLDGKLRHAGI